MASQATELSWAPAFSGETPRVGEWPLPARFGAWAMFWLLNLVVGIEDYLRSGRSHVWEPVIWEGTSCVVATIIIVWQWRALAKHDALLGEPRRWFTRLTVKLLPASIGFVTAVYALRHAVYAMLGLAYTHEPWADVYLYETPKFAIFFLLFGAVYFGVRSYAAATRALMATAQAQVLAKQAQLLQLAQQIEPHFLFNAIGTIAETVHTNPTLADKLLTQLAALLRAATDLARQPIVTLREDLALLESYAAIMRERFADRVEALHFDVDAQLLDCKVPTLLLQPLLENAFRHGVEKHLGVATLHVTAKPHGANAMRLAIGCNLGALRESATFGTGLSNLRERLAATFGPQASLTLARLAGGGVESIVIAPCVR